MIFKRVKFLEDEMKQLNAELLNEKLRNQEFQRDKMKEVNLSSPVSIRPTDVD